MHRHNYVPTQISRFLKWTGRPAACLAALLLALLMPSIPAGAQDTSNTLILFDTSGSMWGKLDGSKKPKFAVASDALKAATPEGKQSISPTGLIVFGGSCASAPMTIPAASKSFDDIHRTLERLNPKGKGPISLAIETAAAALPKNTHSNLILIHDGPDNCRRDPCATAQAFAQSHPNVPIHLISVDLPKASRAATACIAKLTRGTVAQVENKTQLDAAIKHAVDLAMHANPPLAADISDNDGPGTNENDQTQANIKPDTTGPPRLRLSARFGEKGNLLKVPVRWQVFPESSDNAIPPLLDIAEPQFTLPLEPGKYIVQANIGILQSRETIDVAVNGATDLTVVFEAGVVRMRAPVLSGSQQDSSTVASEGTFVTFYSSSSSNNEPGATDVTAAPIVVAAGSTSEVILPSGSYKLITQRGRSRIEHTIEVKTATTADVDLTTKNGELSLALTSSNEAIIDDGVLYKLYVDNPNSPSGRKEIARSTAKNPSFVLPAGTYYVSGEIGLASTREQVAISPGTASAIELNLETALLRLQTQLVISGRQTTLPVQYRIIRLADAAQEIARSNKSNPKFIVTPGKYRIVAEIGARNVMATTEVDLPAGSKTTIKLNPSAGEVVLSLDKDAAEGSVNRYWIVRDQSGTIIWRTNTFSPTALLAPGAYEVSCETRTGEIKKSFNLAAGEKVQVTLAAR